MNHRRAVWTMVLVTLLWSTAGVVSRHLERAQGVEVTCLRSGFTALALIGALVWRRGAGGLLKSLQRGGSLLWLSGLCWATMFTAFMLALSWTRIANVLVTMASAPLLTALGAWLWLGFRLPLSSWLALALAALGIVVMFAGELGSGTPRDLAGMSIALLVPLASSVNWLLLQRHAFRAPVAVRTQVAELDPRRESTAPEAAPSEASATAPRDFLPAVLIGALLSFTATLPLAWPFQASAQDLALLAGLGTFQLALPCLLMVLVARVLPGPELSLLALLEVLFGVLWAWAFAGEALGGGVLLGGALVLAGVLLREGLGARAAALASERGPGHAGQRP